MKPVSWLLPFSWVYGTAVWFRNWFFDINILTTIDVGVPVISVGNITAGGTGKTPVVMNIVEILRKSSRPVAIVSRGYGRKSRGTIVVSDGTMIKASVEEAGDEALMLAQKCPGAVVIVDENRVRGARTAIADFNAESIVLDDGFQHRYIHRTLDIVLVDAGNSPMKTRLLPAGYRREPIKSLNRSNVIVVTKAANEAEFHETVSVLRQFGRAKFFRGDVFTAGLKNTANNIVQSAEMLSGHSVIAFSGIGSPESFERSLVEQGAVIKKMFRFSDHYFFTQKDCEIIVDAFRLLAADFIVTTEKDAVRLSRYFPVFRNIPLFALQIESRIYQEIEWGKILMESVL